LDDHTSYDGSLQNEICGHEVARPSREWQDCAGHRIGRIGDQAEGASGRNKVLQVAPNHRSRMIAHLRSKFVHPPGMQFDRDNPSARIKKGQSEGAVAGS
jgi:hypothetical protein